MASYQWNPTADYIDGANVTRLARAHGLAGIDELRARSVADPAWFWDAVATDLGLLFRTPYSRVMDLHNGIEHPDWFVGARMNIVDSCLLRWCDASPSAIAVSHEDEAGQVRELTFNDLAAEVGRAANGLRELGIGPGDAVATYLPMIPEAVVACYAVAALGAVLVPLFSGFAPTAIASRLVDAKAKAVIVADATTRRGRTISLLPQINEALAHCASVQHVIVVPNAAVEPPKYVGARMVLWSQLTYCDAQFAPSELDAMHPLLLAYTSGTTGKPKGAVHTHAGFLVKTAGEVAYSFDVKPGGVFCWITDMGWIMGPLSVFGTHANGATLLLYEGSPDTPDAARLWRLVERHRVTMLGVSPTLVRALRPADVAQMPDLSSVHVLGSTGEPWDPESYDWLARDVFGGRVPVINFSGGTEVGGSFLAPYPVETIRSCSLGGPSLGMDVDVVDDDGNSVRGQVGELVCRQPWPSMTRGIWQDEERYRQAYWARFPGMWTHGDFALVDGDGQWFILGRSDDVMNVAGKRLAPAEVESVMNTHPCVAEAAAVGVPDPVKGEAVWAFWVPRPGEETVTGPAADEIGGELAALVGRELGKPFAPSRVWRVAALPKTRSAKIMRRAIRAAALGVDPGDLSGAENPDAVGAIRRLVGDPVSPVDA